jgi:hypothetical protein
MIAMTVAPTAAIEITRKITDDKNVDGISVGSGEGVEEPEAVGTAEDEGNCDDFEVGVEVKKSTGVGVPVACFSSVLDWVLSSFHKEECDCKSY